MFNRDIDCLAPPDAPALPVTALRPDGLAAFLAGSPHAAFLTASGFAAAAGDIRLLPGGDGIEGAVLGLGTSRDPREFGALPFGLPPRAWRIEAGDVAPDDAVLGFCLGAYQFTAFKPARPCAQLQAAPGEAAELARSVWAGARPHQHTGRPARPGRVGRRPGHRGRRIRRRSKRRVRPAAAAGLPRRGRGRRRVGPAARSGHAALARQPHRAPDAPLGRAVRQRRLLRHRRLRHQALRGHVADEEGHGRRGHHAWARPQRDGAGLAGAGWCCGSAAWRTASPATPCAPPTCSPPGVA